MNKTLLVLFLLAAACGSSSSGSSSSVISLGASGPSPATVTVAGGTSLQFSNSDTVDHQIASSSCPELSSPTLAAGASFDAVVGAGPKTCDFYDGLQPSSSMFNGTVIVQSGASNSNGY